MQTAFQRNRRAIDALIPQVERRLSGFDERNTGLYTRGQTVRDIQASVEAQYGVKISSADISTVTDPVLEEAKKGQN